MREGQLDLARAHLEETIAVAEQVGNVLALTYLWSHLGDVLVLQQRCNEAAAPIRRSLIECRRRGMSTSMTTEVANLAYCASRASDPTTASLLYGSADAMFTAHAARGQRVAREEACASLWSDDQSRLRGLLGDEERRSEKEKDDDSFHGLGLDHYNTGVPTPKTTIAAG